MYISLKKYNDESFKTVVNTFYRKLNIIIVWLRSEYIQNILDDFSGRAEILPKYDANDGLK